MTEFVKWIQEQDFYENTTIVISGDHPTMDSDFCEDVDESYGRKVYTAYINSVVASTGEKREYTTLDDFPTTLAALGVQIEGDRLALEPICSLRHLRCWKNTVWRSYQLN